jgi:hypothetical protein
MALFMALSTDGLDLALDHQLRQALGPSDSELRLSIEYLHI